MVVNLFSSSNSRPSAVLVKEVVDKMEKDGFGVVVSPNKRLKLFFKTVPKEVDEDLIEQYITTQHYEALYREKPFPGSLEEEKFQHYINQAPDGIKEHLNEYDFSPAT